MDNEGKWSALVSLEIGIGDFPDASIDSVTGCNLIDWAQCFAANKPSFELALIGRWFKIRGLTFKQLRHGFFSIISCKKREHPFLSISTNV